MGTRSLTHVYDCDTEAKPAQPLVTIYKQYDGYPSGLGAELCKFMQGFVIVNGISSREGKIANGGGCFAAQLVKHLKEEVGGVYLYPVGSTDCGEEFTYKIYIHPPQNHDKCGRIVLEIHDGEEVRYSGSPADVAKLIADDKEKDK